MWEGSYSEDLGIGLISEHLKSWLSLPYYHLSCTALCLKDSHTVPLSSPGLYLVGTKDTGPMSLHRHKSQLQMGGPREKGHLPRPYNTETQHPDERIGTTL